MYQLCFQTGTIGTIYPLFELIPPLLVQMPPIDKPCLKLGQLRANLSAHLSPALGLSPLGGGVQTNSRSNQINNDPRCFKLSL